MLSGLAFTDERETRKERKRDDRKSRKKESKSKKQRRAERDASEEDATERRRRDSTSASASEERTRVHEGARERPISPQQATDADAPAEQSDFFSAALASKARSRADEGKEAERRKEEERAAKIVASRELNPQMRGDCGDASVASKAPMSVVGDGGASWRLKALRRAQERAAAEGRNVNEVVSEHWGSVNELVSSIGDNAAHGKAHLHARRGRAGGRQRGGGEDGARMQVPETFGARHRPRDDGRPQESERLRAEDKQLINSALETKNKFASDGSFMDEFHKVSKYDAKPTNFERELPRAARELPPTRRPVPESRNLVQHGSTNMSAAAALKARLFGGKSQAKTEEALIEALPMVTADGRAAPGAFGRNTTVKGGANVAEGQVRRAPKTTQRFDGGERSRYFADDDGKSLRDLVAEQKYEGTNDYDRNLADNIARHKRYKGKELDVDDEYDHDGGLEMYESRDKKWSNAKQQARAKEQAVRDFKRAQALHNKCLFCIDAPNKPKHLHVAYGNLAYLMLPPHGRLVPGHCLIAPIAHAQSSRAVDEDVWEEMRNFKKCLVRMFAQEGKACCFIETAMKFGHGGMHAVVECIPIPQEMSEKAKMYFRKEIDECESEWSTHDAKKCLSTAPPKGLRSTIPANFPYTHVEFGMQGGFVHVIDDESKWNRNFGRNILIGLLNLPEHLTDAKQRPLAPALLRDEMEAFLKMYEPCDWTTQLD